MQASSSSYPHLVTQSRNLSARASSSTTSCTRIHTAERSFFFACGHILLMVCQVSSFSHDVMLARSSAVNSSSLNHGPTLPASLLKFVISSPSDGSLLSNWQFASCWCRRPLPALLHSALPLPCLVPIGNICPKMWKNWPTLVRKCCSPPTPDIAGHQPVW